jgi:hypothetical protein
MSANVFKRSLSKISAQALYSRGDLLARSLFSAQGLRTRSLQTLQEVVSWQDLVQALWKTYLDKLSRQALFTRSNGNIFIRGLLARSLHKISIGYLLARYLYEISVQTLFGSFFWQDLCKRPLGKISGQAPHIWGLLARFLKEISVQALYESYLDKLSCPQMLTPATKNGHRF